MEHGTANAICSAALQCEASRIRYPERKGKTVASMLLVIMRGLDHAHDEDELRIWGPILVAFHFMLRTMDYCAKLEGGKVDLDNVPRVCDLIFKRNGKVIKNNYRQADEMLAILGREKCTEGGEVRSQQRSAVTDLCVVQTMGRLYEKLQYGDKNRPLFTVTWSRGSKRPGQGVLYCDIMQILKDAAEACGRDTERYGTHSLRRGGGSAYLMAGKTLEAVAFYGRWADVRTCRLYVEPSASHLMRGAQDKVSSGVEEPHYILRQPARPREFQIKRAAAKLVKKLS